MRTVKWNAFLSGLCGVAVALGLVAASARADVTTERGASILAFPKVLADGTADTIIQITNVSNSMVHARCFYVNAAEDPFGNPLWQVTDFHIWLTKQQPTHWQVSTGRRVDPTDSCFLNGRIIPQTCANAGIDPGAVPPVPGNFIGELKCVEVDVSDNPIGGNHLKGEATIKVRSDVSKYNAIGIEATERAGETGNELRLDQPSDTDDPVGQYNACPNVLILNHFTEGTTDPVIMQEGFGGTCMLSNLPCETFLDCPESVDIRSPDDLEQVCRGGARILDSVGGQLIGGALNLAPRSVILTDLTLIPCQQDFENNVPGQVTVQFQIYNEFEQVFSASTTIDCWANFFLFEVTSPNNPQNSPFSKGVLGTTVAQSRISPVPEDGGIIGVAGVTRFDKISRSARAALNIHVEGDRLSASEGEVVDIIRLSDR